MCSFLHFRGKFWGVGVGWGGELGAFLTCVSRPVFHRYIKNLDSYKAEKAIRNKPHQTGKSHPHFLQCVYIND